MEFIYDRKQSDIDDKTPKAYMTVECLNRIESNCYNIGIEVAQPTTTKTWSAGGLPNVSDFNRVTENVSKIRSSLYSYEDTPLVPQLPINHYEKVNDIEHILHDVHTMYTGNKNNIDYVGELYCSDGIGVI